MNMRVLSRKRLPGTHVRPVLEWAIVCGVCELDITGHGDENEAAYLAGIHNDLHHGSRPDAFVAPISEPDRPSQGLGGAA